MIAAPGRVNPEFAAQTHQFLQANCLAEMDITAPCFHDAPFDQLLHQYPGESPGFLNPPIRCPQRWEGYGDRFEYNIFFPTPSHPFLDFPPTVCIAALLLL